MRYLNLLLFLLIASVAFAQLNGDGYYRVKNVYSTRYLYLMDNKGTVNTSSASADVSAIVPFKGEDKMISDPATIFKITSITGGYKLSGQGVSTTDIIGDNPITITERGNGVYWCSASQSGSTLYLGDTEIDRSEEAGQLEAIGPSKDSDGRRRGWNIFPVSSDTQYYFGVKPTFSVNGKHYTSFYVDFPFSFVSSGMKAYTVTKNNKNKAVLTEITSSVIPAKTPVLIECSSVNPSDNRLNIGGNEGAGIGTILKGNFFCYDPNPNRSNENHENLTPVTSAMRVFGVTSNGKLGLVMQEGLNYLPANCAYFEASGIDAELVLMSEEEFNIPDVVDVTSISLNITELSLDLYNNATANLVATITPADATDKTLTWSSSNESVATVANGVVTANNVGEATITVRSSNGITATCKVTVVDTTPILVSSIALNMSELSLDLNGQRSFTLTATIAPENATDKTLTWSSSNESVATVANGVVTANNVGEATITVQSSNGITATCKVTVIDTTPIFVSSITLNMTELIFDLNGETSATLIATITPENATDKTLTWSSSNDAVAKVSSEGVVTAVSVGEAIVTVSSSNGLTANCKVIVEDNSAIDGVTIDGKPSRISVYTIDGKYIGNSTDAITKGLYIINGKKVLSE